MAARSALRWAVASALLALVGAPPAAEAQWAAGPGRYWAKASVFRHVTTEQYRFDGGRRAFFQPNAESRSTAVFFDVLVGVTERLDLWAQLPWFDLRFEDDTGLLHDSGISDLRLSLRYNVLRLHGGTLPLSLRYTVKAPLSDLPVDRDVIPVSEGQWDHEVWLEAGLSLWPAPAYTVVWLGYRWRTVNQTTTVDPGDERAFLVELGLTPAFPLGVKVVTEGSFGLPTTVQGVGGPNDRREIVQIQTSATWTITLGWTLEVGPRIPLHGKNFPAGRQWVFALFHRPPDAS